MRPPLRRLSSLSLWWCNRAFDVSLGGLSDGAEAAIIIRNSDGDTRQRLELSGCGKHSPFTAITRSKGEILS
jgi:hypothetical protein